MGKKGKAASHPGREAGIAEGLWRAGREAELLAGAGEAGF